MKYDLYKIYCLNGFPIIVSLNTNTYLTKYIIYIKLNVI